MIAERHEECTVLFADLVGFTSHTADIAPDRLVDELNQIFSSFDDLVSRLDVMKIKTIGDAYMVAAGVPAARPDHVEVVCELALQMQVRVGVATGEVVAGVIGTAPFTYDIWGDTVNLASRLQRHAEPGQILVSESVETAVGHAFRFRSIGDVDLKGKGTVRAHVLEARRGRASSIETGSASSQTGTLDHPRTATT